MAETSARRLFERALKAGEDRDYRKSAELLTAVLSQTDSMPEALLYLGRARYALGERARAIDAFRLYLKSGGEEDAGFFFLGRAYLALGRNRAAAACLRRSAEAGPRRPPTWALLGATYLKLHRTKSAVECMEKAVTLAPADERIRRGYVNILFARALRLLAHGDADMARQMLSYVIANGLDGTAPRLWRARTFRALGRLDEALADCEAALGHAPSDVSIRWVHAGILLAAGRQAEALAEFERIRVDNPGLPSALPQDDRSLARLRASTAFLDGRWKEAASQALALLRIEPDDAPLRALAAESLRTLGEHERSRDHWLRAVEADPKSPELRLGLAMALWDLGSYQEALAAVERARRLGAESGEVDYYSALCRARLGEDGETLLPTLQALVRSRAAAGEGADPRLLFALGETLYRSGRPDLASGWFEKVLLLVPEHELSLLYRISVAESLGRAESLPAAYEAYLELYPDNAKLRREYVNLLVGGKDWEKAAAALEGGLPYAEPGERGRRLLALCYRSSGRYREAAIVYRDLLRQTPSSGELLVGLAHCLDKDGKTSFALALLEKAPAEAKSGVEPWILLGAFYARLEKAEAAVDALRRATEIAPDNPRPWRNLGLLYRRQGLPEFADRCLERAEELEAAGTAPRPATKPRPKSQRSTRAASDGSSGLADAIGRPKPASRGR
ncbi:MAG: tetratricopeptide repeat protein [Treponema sp.]|nr:tetratricopeptide repeat protein [Treponema sp.]